MTALFLKIENPGVAPSEGFTIFGATTKRHSDDPRTIGTFGSGTKHGMLLLLRNEINPVVFCGGLRLSFYTEPMTVTGVSNSVTQLQVCVRYGGTDTQGVKRSNLDRLSVVLDHGTADWTDISSALREYVSNALDACYEQGLDHTAVSVEIVGENQVRAAKGSTRIFIPLTPDVQQFYNNLGKMFLHFSEPENLGKMFLPKNRCRNKDPKRRVAVIYRRGVFVREFESDDTPSIFDYNLCDLQLDESRHADDWKIRHECAKALRTADADTLAMAFRALVAGQERWELKFDEYGFVAPWSETPEMTAVISGNWKAAFTAVAGDQGVLCGPVAVVGEMVEKKGYRPIVASAAWVTTAQKLGVRTDETVLTTDDRVGRTYSTATQDVTAVLDWVWWHLERLDMTAGKSKPKAECFYQQLEAGSQVWGFQQADKVYIHTDIATGQSQVLRWVMLEEVAHYVTQAHDFTRDFQTFFVRLCAALMIS